MMRKLITLLLFLPVLAMAQKPFINNISPTHVEVGQTVTIAGSNLSGTSDVYFGGISASFTEISDNLLEATVPAGATNNSIYVINGGNIAQSSRRFFISFVGSDISNYDAEFTQTTNEKSASDLCICDLDNDFNNDVVIIHNIQTTDNTQNEVSVFINNSTSATPSFTLTQLNVSSNGSGFYSVACADLDNDGDNDLAFSSNLGTNAADIFILEGDGTGSFNPSTPVTKTLPNTSGGDQRLPGSIEAADLDGDGLLDLVTGNRTDGTFHIFKNTGSLAFNNAVEITATSESTGLLKVSDFNNDGYQDIVTLPFRQSSTSIHIFKNTSTINNFNFEFQQTISNGGQTSDVETGDLNNDGFLDIVVASNVTGEISRFLNLSSGNSISFGSETSISTSSSAAFGVSLGDINGDGALDITASNGAGNVYVLENNGAGSFSNEQELTTGASTQSIVVGDLNGDAKPDMAYSQDVQINGPLGKLGVFLNRNCVTPVLSPSPGDGTFCSTPQTFTLNATFSPGATYTWAIIGGSNTDLGSGTSSTTSSATFELQNPDPTTIRVTIDEGDGTCNTNNDEQTYTISGTQTSPAPTIDGVSGIACAGDAITLSSTKSGTPYDNYYWVKPDGSIETATEIILNPVSVADAGTYTLRVSDGSECLSVETSIDLEVSEVPGFGILNNGGDDFCASSSVTLEVPDFSTDYTYQWVRDGGTNLGTSATQVVSQSGSYTVEITEQAASGCTYTTPAYIVNAIAEPVSIVNGPSETCLGIETTFTAGSTGQSGFTLSYDWQVDGSPVTPTDPTQLLTTFNSTGGHTVTLTTSYDPSEVDACSDVTVFNVTVSTPPTSLTFNESDGVQKCQAEAINIGITDSGISTYNWSIRNAAASPNDTIISTGVASVSSFDLSTSVGIDSVYAIIDVVTGINCTVRDSILVRNFPSNVDISSSDFDASSDVITLQEVNFVSLTANNVTNPRWRPNEIMSDSTSNTVTVFPNQPSTIVTLIGTDNSGCTVSTAVEIVLDNLRPKRTFSPNGDNMNDCWEILNSSQNNTTGCKVYVFDARGRNIFEGEAPFSNNCVWDGNFNGSPVPEGVYYFVFKCPDSQMSKSGSILLAR